MVKALHGAGIEVILDVVYNHTAEGNHLGPMLSFRGVDNQSYYRLVPDDPRYYMDYTGTGNTLNPRAPDGAAADHGLAALLRHRLPRRRLPLRPRVGARARVLRGRSPLGVLRHHPPGPDPLPGEADRRAVGRRPRRLPGRELPDPLVGVERHLSRRDARLLARRGAGRCIRLPLRRFGRPVRDRRPAALRVDQLHHGARRVHARRPRLVQRQAQRGERREQPGRHRRQPLVELRGRRADRRRVRSSRCAAASSATS